MKLLLRLIPTVLLLLSPALFAQGTPNPPFRFGNEITQITDNIYRAGTGSWHSIFLVTEEGIILVDPLNPEFSAWLKEQLDERFEVPVRYVIYSHSHFDHVEGGSVFADTATFIAHEGVARNMDGRYPNMPGDMIDRDHNGLIDRDDIMIPTNDDPGICGMSEAWFEGIDQNNDGISTPAEMQQQIVPPDYTYSERMTLTLGGKTVELMHPGQNHGDDMTAVFFPEERVVFAADMIADALVQDNIRSLPSACGPLDGTPIDEWIRSYEAVYALDFDIFAGGHGGIFTKEDVALPIQFLEDLKSAVSEGLSAGQTLEEMKEGILLEDYADWYYYDRLREKNIEAMYRNLTMFRF